MRRTISMALLPPIHPPKIFPFCVVWTPIPVISWLYPFIGHMGVCTSNGVIFDFAGSYYVQMDDMAFGLPTRYWRLDPAKARRVLDPEHPESVRNRDEPWDSALQTSTHIYQTKQYNFLGDNCHSYVAHFLNSINYAGWNQWNMILLSYNMLAHGSFVNLSSLIKTYGPPSYWCPLASFMAARSSWPRGWFLDWLSSPGLCYGPTC
eukprot:jgi/Botrbrau1/3499/Bobra.341_2s0029.1